MQRRGTFGPCERLDKRHTRLQAVCRIECDTSPLTRFLKTGRLDNRSEDFGHCQCPSALDYYFSFLFCSTYSGILAGNSWERPKSRDARQPAAHQWGESASHFGITADEGKPGQG